jgi:shikimate dehydrogenase
MTTLVLGAGGSARAAVWALREAGAREVSVWNRTPERAVALANDLGARVVREPEPADLLVNCTSVGLAPNGDAGTLGELRLTVERIADYPNVVDMVYRSSSTPLVVAAKRHGAFTVDGLEVLLAQGALSFELWTERAAPREVMRAALETADAVSS